MVSTEPFTFSIRLGMLMIVQAACTSAIAVAGLLLYITFKAVVHRRWPMETQTHYYFLNLLVSDLVQAIGGILSVKWVAEAQVTQGALCVAQGILKQVGDVGVALTTLTIAVHTFLVLIFSRRPHPSIALVVIAFIWIFILLAVAINAKIHNDYYGSTQYWCWITADFVRERIGLEYVWLWLTCALNIIVYVFLALMVKGIVTVENNKILFRKHRDTASISASSHEDTTYTNSIAISMLLYPAVYIITTLPIAIVRWMAFNHRPVPFAATALASIFFSSSGLLNVILYSVTRPKLLRGALRCDEELMSIS